MNEYEKTAKELLKKIGAKLTISQKEIVDGFPGEKRGGALRWKYRVKICPRAGKSYSFNFFDSVYNFNRDERPGAYDILASVEKHAPASDAWEFANEYGYAITTKEDFERVERIRRACARQFERISEIFGEYMNELREIN